MSTKIIRKHTIAIDIHNLNILPQIEDVHILVRDTLPATVDNIVSLELDSYSRKIYIKTISEHVAEKFINYCKGKIEFTFQGASHTLPVTLVEDDYVTVTVTTVPSECSEIQLQQYFSQYGEVVRIVSLNHASHLVFPLYSGRRLVVFKKLNVNIPQHIEIGGIKLRASYSSQIKSCKTCGGNHLRYVCPLNSEDGVARRDTNSTALPQQPGPVVMPITTQSRKRMLSAENSDSGNINNDREQEIDVQEQVESEPMEQSLSASDFHQDTNSELQTTNHDTIGALLTRSQLHTETASQWGGAPLPERLTSLSQTEYPDLESTFASMNKDQSQVLQPHPPFALTHDTNVGPPPPSSGASSSPSLTARATAMVTSLLSPKVTVTSGQAASSVSTVQDKKKTKQEVVPKLQRTTRFSSRDKKGGT